MTDFIHEAPPPENPKPAAPEKPTSEKERQKRVYAYIAVLFTVAFILILWSFLANHRSNQQVIDQLKGSTSMMQSTLEQNAKLEDEWSRRWKRRSGSWSRIALAENRRRAERGAGKRRKSTVRSTRSLPARKAERPDGQARASPVYAPFHTIL